MRLLHLHQLLPRLLPVFAESVGYEKIGVRPELEDEVGGINEEEEDGGSAGDEKKTGSVMLLDGTGLAGCPKHVEHVILNGLRHEISGGNHQRFSWNVKTQIEECGNKKTHTDARESHEGCSVLCRSNPEIALVELQAASQERASQNEKQVGENGAKKLSQGDGQLHHDITSRRGEIGLPKSERSSAGLKNLESRE